MNQRNLFRWLCVLALACLAGVTTFAQGGATSTISGVVVDSGGGAIPGATVVVKNEAGTTFETVTNTEGVFTMPALNAGVYTRDVSLSGFKTAVMSDVRVVPGTPASVKAVARSRAARRDGQRRRAARS